MKRAILLGLLAACGDNGTTTPPVDSGPPPLVDPTDNAARAVTHTAITTSFTERTGTAVIDLAGSDAPGATLEVGDLQIDSVKDGLGRDVPFEKHTVAQNVSTLALGVPAVSDAFSVTIAYHFGYHEGFTGASSKGFTLDWPYYCGNIFPCQSNPAVGQTFDLDLQGIPDGKTAVFPASITSAAPAYQLAWDIDDLTEQSIGTTPGGTAISVWYRANGLANAQKGAAHLVDAFDWLERTLGTYRFGPKFSVVSVGWPQGAFGGMEHHPFVHVATAAMGDEVTQIHEASHGWFGDGIRIACWEDFVLSEGTVSYLAARALDVVAPDVGAAAWTEYANELAAVQPGDPTWPDSCGVVDVEKDNLFTQAPYMRGAFFYRAVAKKVGAEQLDAALGTFFQAHQGGAARMQDMLDTIKASTGYDATACAQSWLRATDVIPAAESACP